MAEATSAERLDADGMLSGSYRKSRVRAWLDGETGTLYATDLEFLLTENDQLRVQLDGIGETHEEWAADGPAGWMQDPTGFDSERFARGIVEQATEQGVAVKLMRRLAGVWCEVPNV